MDLPQATMPPRTRIVLVKGTDGLGNRLLAILSAIIYGRISGREVVVDWRDGYYANLGTNAFPCLFRSNSVAALDRDFATDSVAPWMWKHHLHMSAEEMYEMLGPPGAQGCPFVGRLYSFDPDELNHPADVIVMWSLISLIGQLRRHFTGLWTEWKNLDEETILARLLRENLEVHPEIAARAEEIRGKWPDRPRIGVHARNTDRTTNLRRVRRALDNLLAEHPQAVIFLATDSSGVENDFRRRYPEVLTVPKWFPPSGPLHTLKAPCPDRLGMAQASLVEMRLLTLCDHLIINGNSSFSQITKLWWQGNPRDVIDVASWAWLPPIFRDHAWRSCAGLRWTPWIWSARRHIRKQRFGYDLPRTAIKSDQPRAISGKDPSYP